MTLINYFGEEFEREEELTSEKLRFLKDMIEIYIAMRNTKGIDDVLKTLTLEEAKSVCGFAQLSYIKDRMKYVY